MKCRDRLFKAVQETLPEKKEAKPLIRRLDSVEDVARSVRILMNGKPTKMDITNSLSNTAIWEDDEECEEHTTLLGMR